MTGPRKGKVVNTINKNKYTNTYISLTVIANVTVNEVIVQTTVGYEHRRNI